MHLIKSIGDGMGTAAGVAWPLFGIVSGTLSLTCAGAAAIWLGTFSFILFIIVAIPITLWSYHQFRQERLQQKRILKNLRRMFDTQFIDYLNSTINETLLELHDGLYASENIDYLADLKRKIKTEMNDSSYYFSTTNRYILARLISSSEGDHLLEQLIAVLKPRNFQDLTQLSHKLTQENRLILQPTLQRFYAAQKISIPKNDFKLHLTRYIKTGIMGFCASFGSVAGCGAGLIGMLTGVGVFAGLAPVPVVGWLCLGLAITFGLTVAAISIYSAYKKDKKAQSIHRVEEMKDNFHEINNVKSIRLATELDIRQRYHLTPQRAALRTLPAPRWMVSERRPAVVDFQIERRKMLQRNRKISR